MAFSIVGRNYDENKLDDQCKNSVVQVQQLKNRFRSLQAEFDNVKILIAYHSKFLTDKLPAKALIEDKAKVEDKTTSAQETTKA